MEDVETRSGLQTSTKGDQIYVYYHQWDYLAAQLADNQFEIINVVRKVFPVESNAVETTDLFVYARAISR